jgi:hypothetical protein
MIGLGFLCKWEGEAEWVGVKQLEGFGVKRFDMAGRVAGNDKTEGLSVEQFLIGGETKGEGWFVRRRVVGCWAGCVGGGTDGYGDRGRVERKAGALRIAAVRLPSILFIGNNNNKGENEFKWDRLASLLSVVEEERLVPLTWGVEARGGNGGVL